MIKLFKNITCILLVFSIINTVYSQNNNNINYGKYIKNYYHVPSYDNIEQSYKNDFYENVYNQLYFLKDNVNDNISSKIYKTKLDKIILYI